jgi:hypothetical protein
MPSRPRWLLARAQDDKDSKQPAPPAKGSSPGGGKPSSSSSSSSNDDSSSSGRPMSPTRASRYSKMVEELAQAGLTPAKAKAVLKAWSELGARDPEALRRESVVCGSCRVLHACT